MNVYTDQWVTAMLSDPKPFPQDWRQQLILKETRGGQEASISVTSFGGFSFKITLKQNRFNQLNFGAFLFLSLPDSSHLIHLLRYDGKYHDHFNALENERIVHEFHIYQFTERYFSQYGSEKMDAWAYVTDRYHDLDGAFRCLIQDANIELPQGENFLNLNPRR